MGVGWGWGAGKGGRLFNLKLNKTSVEDGIRTGGNVFFYLKRSSVSEVKRKRGQICFCFKAAREGRK